MAVGRRKAIILWVVGAIIVLGGAAVAFGPYIYRDVTMKDAPVTPSLDLSTSTGDSLADVSGTWRAATGSYAGYRTDEVLRGVDVTVVGRTDRVTGELTVSETTVTAARISVDMASVATGNSARDSYFHDNIMQTSDYPNAVFELMSPIQIATPLAAGQKTTYEVTGKLTIHGVTREIKTQLETGFDGTHVHVAGSIPITFSDYNVTAPDLGFVTVEKDGHIELLIKFER